MSNPPATTKLIPLTMTNIEPSGVRNGLPFYNTNPFVVHIDGLQKYLNLPTGAITKILNLSKTGRAVLEILLEEAKELRLLTVVSKFNHYRSNGIAESSFHRGIKDLLDSGLIFHAEVSGLIFMHSDLQWKIDGQYVKAAPKVGFVYLLYDESSKLTKIGCTTKEGGTRQKAIMGAHPTVLVNVMTHQVDDCFLAESQCHKHFSNHRKNGEWFDAPIEDIKNYLQNHFTR